MEAALRGPLGKTVLEPAVLTIGSSPDNRLVVDDPKVSAHHAEIRPEGQGFSITDLGSTHGTYVNGQRLDWNAPHALTQGCTIAIGDATFIYEIGDAAPVASPSIDAGAAPERAASETYSPTIPTTSTPAPGSNPAYALPQAYMPQPMPPYMPQYPQQPPPPGYPGTYPGYFAPYPPGAAPVEAPPARRFKRRWLWIVGAIVIVAGLLGGGAAVYFTRATPEKTLDAYCNALQGQDYRSAYNQLSPSLQTIESESDYAGAQQAMGRVTTCTHDNASVTGNEATSNLTLIASGQDFSGIVSLVQANSSWRISVLLSSPELTLTIFCNALRSGDLRTAYNQYSSGLKSANPESQFAKTFQGVICTFGSVNASGSSGTANIVFANASGPSSPYIVILIQDPASNSDWKIDGIQAA